MLAPAHSAGDLQLERRQARQTRDQLVLHRVADARAVEVDDMQPTRAGREEAGRHGGGVIAEHALAVEPALLQADHASITKVDGRVQLEP
jgi:hypothetical protein